MISKMSKYKPKLSEAFLAGPYSPNKKQSLNEKNMRYCRFENTYKDLLDCYDDWGSYEDGDDWEDESILSDSEKKYRKKLFELCQEIVDTYEEDYEEGLL